MTVTVGTEVAPWPPAQIQAAMITALGADSFLKYERRNVYSLFNLIA
jgi:hypothetical protein